MDGGGGRGGGQHENIVIKVDGGVDSTRTIGGRVDSTRAIGEVLGAPFLGDILCRL